MSKFIDTLLICGSIILARHFGRYRHSGWDGKMHYARYSWRGRDWYIPMRGQP